MTQSYHIETIPYLSLSRWFLQEETCIDVCTDDEFEDDGERHHDSIRGKKRLDRHNSDIIDGDENIKMMSYNVADVSPAPSHRSDRSLSDRSGDVSAASTPRGSKESVSGKPHENGIEMRNTPTKPLIVVDDEQAESTP